MRKQILKDGTFIYTHDKGEYISDVIEQTGWYYEPKTIDYIKNMNLKDCNILDIGANIGNHSHAIQKFTTNCSIGSFEPYQKNLDILKRNARFSYHNFVTNKNDEKNYSISPVWGDANLGYITSSKTGESVQKTFIDYHGFDNIGLIKIDIEGHELEALKGAFNTIEKSKPTIIAEHHTKEEHLQVMDYLKQFGYYLATIIEEDNLNYVYKPI
jgi:FkbM family methyltransferase